MPASFVQRKATQTQTALRDTLCSLFQTPPSNFVSLRSSFVHSRNECFYMNRRCFRWALWSECGTHVGPHCIGQHVSLVFISSISDCLPLCLVRCCGKGIGTRKNAKAAARNTLAPWQHCSAAARDRQLTARLGWADDRSLLCIVERNESQLTVKKQSEEKSAAFSGRAWQKHCHQSPRAKPPRCEEPGCHAAAGRR